MIATVLRALVVPVALLMVVGWFFTPDPFLAVFLTALVLVVLGVVTSVRRRWLGWVRTGSLRAAV